MYKCKHCGKEFDNKYKLSGHSTFCKKNPKYQHNIETLSDNRKNVSHYSKNQHLHCQYCNKEIANQGCLVLHERSCELNPNVEKIKQKTVKQKTVKQKTVHLHSDETKQKISEGRKRWLAEHKDLHVWRKDSKFLSVPCENFKSFLKSKNICFVEEYEPFDDIHYSVDIAFPDEKIGIEINGNQHYNRDGSLSEYYMKRHRYFETQGWKLYEIHYTKCYNIKINDFEDILSLPIYDKDYVGKYFSKKEQKKKQKEQEALEKKQKQISKTEYKKQVIINLIENSGIDFSKSGWSGKAVEYLKNRNELWSTHIFQNIKEYYPEFLQRNDVWKRKGSNYK